MLSFKCCNLVKHGLDEENVFKTNEFFMQNKNNE